MPVDGLILFRLATSTRLERTARGDRPRCGSASGSAVIQAAERDFLQQQPGRSGHRDGH